MIANILTIAGSDPSGGAGIQADIKAISANGGYAMAAITALTAQNTQSVRWVVTLSPDLVGGQIRTIFDDIRIDAIKIGMIANTPIAEAVAASLPEDRTLPIVLDPVMVAKGGSELVDDLAVAAIRDLLLPKATLLTPNLPEAARLIDRPVAASREAMADQAHELCQLGATATLIKGGHLPASDCPDCLVDRVGATWLEGNRLPSLNTHGTGCTLSSAIATCLGRGMALHSAVATAKDYVASAIAAADQLDVGCGHGPTHHFADLWRHTHVAAPC